MVSHALMPGPITTGAFRSQVGMTFELSSEEGRMIRAHNGQLCGVDLRPTFREDNGSNQSADVKIRHVGNEGSFELET